MTPPAEGGDFLMPEDPDLWAEAVALHGNDYLAAIRWYEERHHPTEVEA